MGESAQDRKGRRILVVDDDLATQKMVQKSLEFQGYQVRIAKTGAVALDLIDSWFPHLILLDINMPDIDGMVTLRALRKKEDYVSTIFLSGKSQPEHIIGGLDQGADDYITKPFDPGVMLARVRTQLRIKDIRDDLSRANHRLQQLVEIDDLTGLFNMRSTYARLQSSIDQSVVSGSPVAALMLDMDHFKSVNDDADHLFGSHVLAEMGRIIQENIRKKDYAARYGGDEFLVVLNGTTLQGAQALAERLRVYVQEHLFKNDLHNKKLTISVGMALSNPSGGYMDCKDLVRIADRALYLAKDQGRNAVVTIDLKDHPQGFNLKTDSENS